MDRRRNRHRPITRALPLAARMSPNPALTTIAVAAAAAGWLSLALELLARP